MTTTAMMHKSALQLGGIHVHQFFKIPTKYNMTPHRRAELSVLKLMKNSKKIGFWISVYVLSFDEIGQFSA